MIDSPSPSSPFPQTRWSLVVRAKGGSGQAVQALGELLKSYWQPLYVFARRSGLSSEDAQDAVQDFYSHIIRVDSLQSADQTLGRLRSFLLGGFQNHMRTMHRDAQRQKRGGGVAMLSLDDAEASLKMQPVDDETPERAYERRWAMTLLEQVLKRLRAEYAARGRDDLFVALEPALVWNEAGMSYKKLGEKLGMSADTVAQSVKRMRTRYRTLLEMEIMETVDSPEAMEEERNHLIRVLSEG
jgi:RNA polymerase sigma factor (sigma-70 family)